MANQKKTNVCHESMTGTQKKGILETSLHTADLVGIKEAAMNGRGTPIEPEGGL